MILSVLSNSRAGLCHTLVVLGLIALWLAIGSVGGVAPVDPWDAVRTAVVLDAARESAASGRRVVIQP
jgi:hypothetical protein